MKVCLLCGETYSDPIDFCFRDGEVLGAIDAPQAGMRTRAEALGTTPGLSTHTPSLDDEPDLTRANRRALMRAASATYLAPAEGGRTPRPAASVGSAPTVRTQTPVSVPPLDEGMADHLWPSASPPGDEPEDDEIRSPLPRGGGVAAAVIGALVVIAVALGAGLLVLLGLGTRPEPRPRTGSETAAGVASHRVVRSIAQDAPARTPVRRVEAVDPSRIDTVEASSTGTAEADPGLPGATAEFLVVLDDLATTDVSGLSLYVDGAPAGRLPVKLTLTAGEHTFLVVNEGSGSAMLEVRRTVDVLPGSALRKLALAP